MKVRFTPSPGAVVRVFGKDGKELAGPDKIGHVEVEPFFATNSGGGEMLRVSALTSGGNEVDKCAMIVGGSNGKVNRRNLTEKSVVPLIDKKFAAKPAAAVTPEPGKSA